MNLNGPGGITMVSNIVVIIGVLLAPITIFSFLNRMRSEMKKDAGERFETAALLQNSINSMMTAFVVGLMRNGIQQGPPVQPPTNGGKYEDWTLYSNNNQSYYIPQLPAPEVLRNSAKRRHGGNGFLIGLLSGICTFLLLALITVLVV